jgi:hypothetical protein
LHLVVRAAAGELSAERIAAVARYDVEDHAGGLGFAESAGGAEHHFLRASDVGRIAAPGVAASPPGVVAITIGPRIVGTSAVNAPGGSAHDAGDAT